MRFVLACGLVTLVGCGAGMVGDGDLDDELDRSPSGRGLGSAPIDGFVFADDGQERAETVPTTAPWYSASTRPKDTPAVSS